MKKHFGMVMLCAAVLVVAVGVAVAAHHEGAELIELDKEWGSAAQGQEGVAAMKKIISEDVVQISGDGMGSFASMIAEAEAPDAPTGPYEADNYGVKYLTDDIAVMTHHAGDPEPHWSMHVWQKIDGKWMVVASSSTPAAE